MGNTHHTPIPRGRHNNLLHKHPELSSAMAVNKWQEWREHKNIKTQKDFANLTEFSPSWISRLESGEIVPDIVQLVWLSQCLNLGASVNVIYEDLWSAVGNILKNKNQTTEREEKQTTENVEKE